MSCLLLKVFIKEGVYYKARLYKHMSFIKSVYMRGCCRSVYYRSIHICLFCPDNQRRPYLQRGLYETRDLTIDKGLLLYGPLSHSTRAVDTVFLITRAVL